MCFDKTLRKYFKFRIYRESLYMLSCQVLLKLGFQGIHQMDYEGLNIRKNGPVKFRSILVDGIS